MEDFFRSLVFKEVGTYATIIVIFTYSVLHDRDVACTCIEQQADCVVYMVLPFLAILFLKLWMDMMLWSSSRYCCACLRAPQCPPSERRGYRSIDSPSEEQKAAPCYFHWFIAYHIIKAVLVALLWVVSVLIDADWYVCCMNSQMVCNRTVTDSKEREKNELRNHSKTYGFSLLLVIIFVTFLISLFYWAKFCGKRCCPRKYHYYTMILEEERHVIKQTLRERAKQDLLKEIQEKVNEEKWEECFNVAETLIEKLHHPRSDEEREDGGSSVTAAGNTRDGSL